MLPLLPLRLRGLLLCWLLPHVCSAAHKEAYSQTLCSLSASSLVMCCLSLQAHEDASKQEAVSAWEEERRVSR
jgi:hypothetical protein